MTTETLATAAVPKVGELTDLVDLYTNPDDLPAADWLKRYSLKRPDPGLRTLSLGTRILKRGLDVSFALTGLLVLCPVLLLVALVVRLSSPGPVIFKQVRVGLNLRKKKVDRRSPLHDELGPPEGLEERRNAGSDRRQKSSYGKHFTLYKFRTMRSDAEKNGARFTIVGDPRITPVGRVMRKTRLDELPQLWNVLKGEMSLVGPRPERPEFIESLSKEIPGYLHRLRLKPGLTGLAQVVNGYDNNLESFRRKVAFDLLYLQNCSVWNDLKILLRTVGVVLTGKGAL